MATNVLPRMMHRVLVENWEAEKAVEEAHKKSWRSTPVSGGSKVVQDRFPIVQQAQCAAPSRIED